MSYFTVGAVIIVPLAKAAGLSHLKQAMDQPSLGSVELDTGKRVTHAIRYGRNLYGSHLLSYFASGSIHVRFELLRMNLLVQAFP